MMFLPFILWAMAQAEGWNTLWLFPLSMLALLAYDVGLLMIAWGVITVWTKVYRRIPERVIMIVGTVVWTAIAGAFMVAFYGLAIVIAVGGL